MKKKSILGLYFVARMFAECVLNRSFPLISSHTSGKIMNLHLSSKNLTVKRLVFSIYIYKEEEEAVFLMCSQEKNYCLSYQQSQQQKNYELTYKSIKTPILGDCMIGKRFSLHLIIEKLTVCLSLH